MLSATTDNALRYCIECRHFLPVDQFKPGCRRNMCKRHYNERMHKAKMEKWVQRPQLRQSYIVWQIAYIDSIKVFDRKISIPPSRVLEILQHCAISCTDAVRLVPMEPLEPLSLDNFCLTSITNRKDMCNVWKRLHCRSTYTQFLDPQYKKTILATSEKQLGHYK